VVVVAGLPVHHYGAGDQVAEAYAMVFLVEAGVAQQHEVARAFRCAVRTVRRHQRRYAEGGMVALATSAGWRPGRRRVAPKRRHVVERLKTQGVGNREIARRLGVTENAIRKLVGPSREGQQEVLPLGTAVASAGTTTALSAAEESAIPSVPSPLRVVVDVEPEATSEALNHGHGSAASVPDTATSRLPTYEAEERSDVHAEHRTRERVIPGEEVAEAVWKREHPLAAGDMGKNGRTASTRWAACAVMRRPPQLGQNPRRLHEKGTRRSKAQPVQPNLAKPRPRAPHPKNSRNSPSTKNGNAVPPPAAVARNVSRCAHTTSWRTLRVGERGAYSALG
jgi:transposase